MTYVYKDPLENGYAKKKMSRRKHNKLFPKAKIKFYQKAEYFTNGTQVKIQYLTVWWVKILETIFLPLVFLIHGVANWKEIMRDYKKMWNEKKYGSFTEDVIWKTNQHFDTLMENLK